MVKAVRVHSVSGSNTVQYEDIRVPPPPEMHVEIRHTAIVANSYDQLAREGHLEGYSPDGSSLKYPFTLGQSGVGVVTEVGSGLLDYQIGHRVCYVTAAEPGSFSEQRVILAKYLVPVPAFLSDERAASVLFEGLEAWMLLRRVFPVKRGDRVLIHEITSGFGSILGTWAKTLGARVIGTVASEADVANARKKAVDYMIPHSNFKDNVLDLTDGEGVHVVFHSIGGDAIRDTVGCIAAGGMLVVVGRAPSPSDSVGESETDVSIAFPVLQDYITRREDLLRATSELFSLLGTNVLSVSVKDKYPLQKAAQALDDLGRQKALGSVILTPPIPDPTGIPPGS